MKIDAAILELWGRAIQGLHDMPVHSGWLCMFGFEGTPSIVWNSHCYWPMLFMHVGMLDLFGHV